MAGEYASESPLEAVVNRIGEGTTEKFELLNNETRLAILLALWEAKDPEPPYSKPALSFSDLRDRVGLRDSGQFNYHLDKLVGQFVRKSEDEYTLTPHGARLVETLVGGILTDNSSFEGGPIDENCPRCGGAVVLKYDQGVLVGRCTNCEGADGDVTLWQHWDYPAAGLADRTPEEVNQSASTLIDHRLLLMRKGVCPFCAGTVTTTLYVCKEHNSEDWAACERCGLTYKGLVHLSCDVCKHHRTAHPNWFASVIPSVRTFLHERGMDIVYSEGRDLTDDALEFEVLSAEPPEIRVRVEFDGDRLDVTLDETAHVTNVSESSV